MYKLCKHPCVATTTDIPCKNLLDFSRGVVTCLSNLLFNDERATQSLADYRIAKRSTASSRFGRSCHIRKKKIAVSHSPSFPLRSDRRAYQCSLALLQFSRESHLIFGNVADWLLAQHSTEFRRSYRVISCTIRCKPTPLSVSRVQGQRYALWLIHCVFNTVIFATQIDTWRYSIRSTNDDVIVYPSKVICRFSNEIACFAADLIMLQEHTTLLRRCCVRREKMNALLWGRFPLNSVLVFNLWFQ